MKRILFSMMFISLISTAFADVNVPDNKSETFRDDKNLEKTKSETRKHFREIDLIQAASNGDLSRVQILLTEGINANVKGEYDKTPIIAASENGHMEIVKLLIEKGADVNAKDSSSRTALMYASKGNGNTAIVKLLLDNGANVNAKDKDGGTALMMASYHDIEMVKLLLDKGADINAKGSLWNDTALWSAVKGEHTDIVKLLLEKGANVNIRTNNIRRKIERIGRTELGYAKEQGYRDIVQLLEKAGAKENPPPKITDLLKVSCVIFPSPLLAAFIAWKKNRKFWKWFFMSVAITIVILAISLVSIFYNPELNSSVKGVLAIIVFLAAPVVTLFLERKKQESVKAA